MIKAFDAKDTVLNQGAKEPLDYSHTAPIVNGVQTTNTISGSPKYSLWGPDGELIVNNAAATGFNNTAATAPAVWTTVDTSTLRPGVYTIAWTFTCTNSLDGIARTIDAGGTFRVAAVP